MRLGECKPRIGEDGHLLLESLDPVVEYGRISRWSSGFDIRAIRNGYRILHYFWSLDLLPETGYPNLPDSVVAFLGEIPLNVRQQISAFRFGQAFMLNQAAAYREAADLLDSNPKLYWLMTCGVHDGKVDPELVGRHCRRKQVEILRQLVPIATKATLRLLSKTEFELGSLSEARVVKHALSCEPIVSAVAHLPRAPFRLLEALTNYSNLAKPSLAALVVRELEHHGQADKLTVVDIGEIVGDIQRIGRWLHVDRPEQAIARCNSRADLIALHDRWLERQQRRAVLLSNRFRRTPGDYAEKVPNVVFPEPPIPDCASIKAIRTPRELIREGLMQQHCVASYAQEVAEGAAYIYRVLSPERATLELRKTGTGWRIGQFKLSRNAEPAISSREGIEEWLAKASKSRGPVYRQLC